MRHLSSERGAELVEMAMVVPILLLLVAGIAESGLLFRTFEVTVNAAREGARLAALPGNEENDYATVRTRVNNYLNAANVTNPDDPTPPDVTITQEAIPIAPGVSANGVRVTVTYEYDCLFLGPVAGLLNGTFADTITYQSSALMRTQVAAIGL
jgi:Flp pilus assembly protein TadG